MKERLHSPLAINETARPPPEKGDSRAVGYIRGEGSLLLAFDLDSGSDLLDQTLKDCARTYFDEAGSTIGDHSLYTLRPAYGSRELSYEVLLDAMRAVDCMSRDILIDRAAWGVELRSLDRLR